MRNKQIFWDTVGCQSQQITIVSPKMCDLGYRINKICSEFFIDLVQMYAKEAGYMKVCVYQFTCSCPAFLSQKQPLGPCSTRGLGGKRLYQLKHMDIQRSQRQPYNLVRDSDNLIVKCRVTWRYFLSVQQAAAVEDRKSQSTGYHGASLM